MTNMLEIYDIMKEYGLKANKKTQAKPNFKRPKNIVVTKLNKKIRRHTRCKKNSTNFKSLDSNEESEDLHENMISMFDVPRLKSSELVSSISTKFDDCVQKMKFHKDFYIDQASITLGDKKIYLKEDEEKHEFNMEIEDQWHIGFMPHHEFWKCSNLSRCVEKDTYYESKLKPHSSSLLKKMELSTLKKLKTNEKFDFNKCTKEGLNAIGTYKSRGVKSVKEDCERFRLQMKILKEKANDSRIREVMVEGLIENLHKDTNEDTKIITMEDTNDTIENDKAKPHIKSIPKSLVSSTHDLNIDKYMLKTRGKIETNKENEKNLFASSMIKESPNSLSSYPPKFDGKKIHQSNVHEDFKARKRIKTYNNIPSYSSISSSSTSSSVSTLSSLPLSHYIQKLKCLAPNSFTDLNKSISKNEKNESLNTESFFDIELSEGEIELEDFKNCNLDYSTNCEKATNIDENNCNMQVDEKLTNHFNKNYSDLYTKALLPIPSSHFKCDTNLGIYACQRANKFVIPSLKNNNRISNGDKINKKVGNVMVENCISPPKNQHLNKRTLNPISSSDGFIFQESKYHSNEDNKYKKFENHSTQQIIFNELKELIEGFNIQIDAKNKILKTRFDNLEKQWDYSKDEMFKEILEARHILQNDIKVRLEEIVNNFMNKNEDNDEHVLAMMEKKIERHQLQSDIGILALKSEMKHLWTEIKELTYKKENIQSYVTDFIRTIEKSKFEVNNEQNLLKNENSALIKQLQNIKQSDMQIEIENIRKLIEKIQENNVELERTQSFTHMEGIRERMLMMERVESLSKLYLGGLKEIRSNISNIKINCRNRVDDLEGQLDEFRCRQKCYATQCHSNLTHHTLTKELESIRTEVAEIVEAERDHIQEMLERENIKTQHQLMTICATNKREILNSMRGELNKRLQCAQNKVLLMTDALKQEMDNLRCEVGETQEGAQRLSKATSLIEKEMEIASRAVTEVSICATKAKAMLNDIQKSFENEISKVKYTCFQLQENLKFEKNMILSVVNEARRTSEELDREKEQMWLAASTARAKNLELNEMIQKESLSIVKAIDAVKNERDVASQAAQEAKCSALKANEVMSEILEYFNGQMIKVQHMSMQLKEGIEQEKRGVQKSCEIALQYNQESLDQYEKELELAIKTWKHAMNVEISKASEITVGLKDEQQRASIALEHVAMLCPQPDRIRADMEKYISKTQYASDNLAQSIHKLQVDQEDYHQTSIVKRQELKQFKDSWQIEISQLQQITKVLEKKLKESTYEKSIIGKRLEMVEKMQVNLVQSYEDVRNITSDLEKTATIWLPKYEVAAKIVNELSSKIKCMDEKLQLTCSGESLMQQIAHITEFNVNGIKDMEVKSHLKNVDIEVKGLLERIDNGDNANCHAIAMLENRVSVLENSPIHDSNMSLKLECIENCDKDSRKGNTSSNGNLNQITEALHRKMENKETKVNEMDSSNSNQEFSSKILGLESRIEHIALATFTNLRLLDKKIEHATAGIQSALDGATMADKKCVALGYELVKVFRMFSCRQNRQHHKKSDHLNKECKVLKTSQSFKKQKDCNEKQDLDSQKQDLDSQNQATNEKSTKSHQNNSKMHDNLQPTSLVEKLDISPRKFIKRGLRNLSKESIAQSFETQKSNLQFELEQDSEDLCGFEDGESFSKNKVDCFHNSLRSKECKLHGPRNKVEEVNIPCDTTLDEQLILEKYQEGIVKNCQRTNIRLEAGRIHVNVSHRSRGLNQLHKKNDLIAVQS